MFSKTHMASGLVGSEWPPSICDIPRRVGSTRVDPGLWELMYYFFKKMPPPSSKSPQINSRSIDKILL